MYWAMLTCQWDLWKMASFFPFWFLFVKQLHVAYMYFKNNRYRVVFFFYTFNLACGVEYYCRSSLSSALRCEEIVICSLHHNWITHLLYLLSFWNTAVYHGTLYIFLAIMVNDWLIYLRVNKFVISADNVSIFISWEDVLHACMMLASANSSVSYYRLISS